VGPELEYYLFRDNRSTDTLDEGGYFDLTTLDAGSDVRRDTVLALERRGLEVEREVLRDAAAAVLARYRERGGPIY
jgi:glutamine synthetase